MRGCAVVPTLSRLVLCPALERGFREAAFLYQRLKAFADWDSLPWSPWVPEPLPRSAVVQCWTLPVLCCFSSGDIKRSQYTSELRAVASFQV